MVEGNSGRRIPTSAERSRVRGQLLRTLSSMPTNPTSEEQWAFIKATDKITSGLDLWSQPLEDRVPPRARSLRDRLTGRRHPTDQPDPYAYIGRAVKNGIPMLYFD